MRALEFLNNDFLPEVHMIRPYSIQLLAFNISDYLIEKLHYRNSITELHLRQKKIGYFTDPNTSNGWYYSPGYSYNLANPNIIPNARNLLSNEVGRIANQKPVEHKIPSHYDAKPISEVFEYTPTFEGKIRII